jgi:hypothetical protein
MEIFKYNLFKVNLNNIKEKMIEEGKNCEKELSSL